MNEREWLQEKRAERIIRNLSKNCMNGHYFASARDAVPEILRHIPGGSVVGLGDSLTLQQTGIIAALEKGDYHLLNPWAEQDGERKVEMQRRIFTADVFVAGTNAITLEGELINMDGRGNRVAAMIFGPKKVLVVAGTNKIVPDREEGFRRIREIAGPANAQRHRWFPKDMQPPCATTGFCSDCKPPATICCALTVIRGQRVDKDRIHVFLIAEELGL
ncbi:MAG: lactate utilization protein [Deltaproteobacteria bacterium]|nr:lactate utilization protein [Deltaproteobacteria bacterium]